MAKIDFPGRDEPPKAVPVETLIIDSARKYAMSLIRAHANKDQLSKLIAENAMKTLKDLVAATIAGVLEQCAKTAEEWVCCSASSCDCTKTGAHEIAKEIREMKP